MIGVRPTLRPHPLIDRAYRHLTQQQHRMNRPRPSIIRMIAHLRHQDAIMRMILLPAWMIMIHVSSSSSNARATP
jgi:hypothetical protein